MKLKPLHDLEELEKREKSKLKMHIMHSLIAGIGISIVALIFTISLHNLVLFACFGSSAAAITFVPKKQQNSIRSVMVSYFFACLVSILLWYLNLRFNISFYIIAFFAVFITTLLLFIFDAFHTSAVGAALGFILYNQAAWQLILLYIGIVVLLGVMKFLEYLYHEELKLEHFYKEFTKKHYGH